MLRKKLSRAQFSRYMERHTRCIFAMEACGSAHHWGQLIAEFGHEVRLVPPVYAKQYMKRHKNDTADAEAASRPTMRFVSVKPLAQQAQAMVYRSRDILVRQGTQLINALRGHLTEFGVVAPQGITQLKKLTAVIDAPETELPELERQLAHDYIDMVETLPPVQSPKDAPRMNNVDTQTNDGRLIPKQQ